MSIHYLIMLEQKAQVAGRRRRFHVHGAGPRRRPGRRVAGPRRLRRARGEAGTGAPRGPRRGGGDRWGRRRAMTRVLRNMPVSLPRTVPHASFPRDIAFLSVLIGMDSEQYKEPHLEQQHLPAVRLQIHHNHTHVVRRLAHERLVRERLRRALRRVAGPVQSFADEPRRLFVGHDVPEAVRGHY